MFGSCISALSANQYTNVRPGACEREAELRIQRGTLSHFSSGPSPQKDNLGSNDEQTDSERGRQKDEQVFG